MKCRDEADVVLLSHLCWDKLNRKYIAMLSKVCVHEKGYHVYHIRQHPT